MPTFQTAKVIAENALRQIGAFPSSMQQADAGELRTTLQWLEMVLNEQTGIRPMDGFFRTIEIPVEAGIGDYDLADYADGAEAHNVFSAYIVNQDGGVDPIEIKYESDFPKENLKEDGTPKRVYISRDPIPTLQFFPTPTQEDEDNGKVIRLRIQTYQEAIDLTGVGDVDLKIRPSWYLWLTKRLAYEIGAGPVRRLAEGELKRLQEDAERISSLLLARAGSINGPRPPVTDPMDCIDVDSNPYRRGYHRC